MQTDLWLTETSDYDKCPLCSRLLKRGTQTCYACGFSNETPSVWIDPQVRAYRQTVSPHTTRDLTPDPQASSPVWQYDSPDFEAAGSLPMLSMFMPETPTQPQPPVQNRATTRRLPDIDEIDTVPPVRGQEQRALVIAPQSAPVEAGSRSWTSGAASGSPSAQLIARYERRKRLPSFHPLQPLDEARWWLLRPGRIEFILWLGGTLLLIGVTCLLLLVSALSFQWFAPSASSGPLASSAYGNNAQQHGILSNMNGDNPAFELVGASSITPGQPFQLRGQGFKPSLVIAFFFDGNISLLEQNHQPVRLRIDKSGTFQVSLLLETNSTLIHGEHFILIRDASGAPVAHLNVQLASGSDNTSTSSIARSSSTPAATPGGNNPGTGTSTPTGPQGTPGNRPPVTPTPTKTPTLSPTPKPTVSPTVSPTAKPSPTVSPTPKTSPTPIPSPARGTPTPKASHTAASAGLGNALNDSGASPTAHLASISPLVWIMVACYLLSMFCLAAAGYMYRRNHKIVM